MSDTLPPAILFTAFEPSGDDHASAVIAELKRRHGDGLSIFAWGGPKMAAAGATIVETTGQNAVIGMPGLRKLLEHRAINKRIARWVSGPGKAAGVKVHVPVDSPGANFPICKLTRARGLKVVHLVAPQIWAWASWRIRKLRRVTDLVLCLLPFEEAWFLERGVAAKFIGHPLFDEQLDMAALNARAAMLPARGAPKLALMPGSRPSEWEASFPILLDAYRRVKQDFPEAAAVVAATGPEAERRLREVAAGQGGWPADMTVLCADTDAVVRWCDMALVVSGTVTLQIARQLKPMVAVYRPRKMMYYTLGWWLISTRVYTLPNLIAGATAGGAGGSNKIIPEFIPHFGDGEDLAVEVIKFMRRTGYADDQRAGLAAVCKRFEGFSAGPSAADAIEKVLADLGSPISNFKSDPHPHNGVAPKSAIRDRRSEITPRAASEDPAAPAS